jgi:redox-sensitive bicupin YhaK (pirin superfamily)
MITVCRNEARHHQVRGKHEGWDTFHAQQATLGADIGFGNLELLNEARLAPGASTSPRPARDSEVFTFVREGAITHDDSLGQAAVMHAGEFRRMTVTRSSRNVETNASRTHGAHLFQAWLRPVQAEPRHEQKRFSTAERRGVLCLVAAPDATRGSLRMRADALVYSALLDAGQHVVHELAEGHSAWLHLVHGGVTLGDLVLETGDGAGIVSERAVSLTARRDTEVLLFDLGTEPRASANGATEQGRDLAG